MLKANEILKTNKNAQLKWLRNQVNKSVSANHNRKDKEVSIFLNPEIALKAFDELTVVTTKQNTFNRKDPDIPESEVQAFMQRYLTEAATKKLITTLRVAESRLGTKTLQVKIEIANQRKLDHLAEKTGMKKVDIINKLIEMADLKSVTKKEEQLEITL